MQRYTLRYRQPYEYDDDSSSGIGDHDIGYQAAEATFEAANDKEAGAQVDAFLALGGVLFDHHIDGDHKVHHRQFISLTGTREVSFKSKQPETSSPQMYLCPRKDCPTWGCQHHHEHTAVGRHGVNWCTSSDHRPSKDCPTCEEVSRVQQ